MLGAMSTAPKRRFRPVAGPLKWHGGKHYLARRIVARMPRHLHYVEPFAGGLAVLLARDPADPRLWAGDGSGTRGVSEVANDINGRLMNFWRVLQDPDDFDRFCRRVEAVPLSRVAWEAAHAHQYGQDGVDDAVAFFIDCRQSLAGRMKGFTSITRNRTRRGMNGNASEWLSAVEGLAEVHARLRPVVLENRPALGLIRRHDGPGTLFYLDPPYLHETRTATAAYGAFELREADHAELLTVLRGCKGKVMLRESRWPRKLPMVERRADGRESCTDLRPADEAPPGAAGPAGEAERADARGRSPPRVGDVP
jgi:DNA adenine methylase